MDEFDRRIAGLNAKIAEQRADAQKRGNYAARAKAAADRRESEARAHWNTAREAFRITVMTLNESLKTSNVELRLTAISRDLPQLGGIGAFLLVDSKDAEASFKTIAMIDLSQEAIITIEHVAASSVMPAIDRCGQYQYQEALLSFVERALAKHRF